MRVFCDHSPRRAADAGKERLIRPTGHMAPAPGHHHRTWDRACRKPRLLASLMGSSPSLSARHGWLRRNALSPHGVRLGSAPGAPFGTGCSSANRALAGKLQRDGIVAVPEVFDAGCLVSRPQPRRPIGDAGEPSAVRVLSDSSPWLAVHGDARRNAKRCGNRENLAAHQCSANQRWSQWRGRCTGSTGLAGSPRRPRIMEGPLVSDTTEILSGGPAASEDAPAGISAPPAAADGSLPRPQERRHRRPSRAAAVVPAFPRCSCPSCSASRRPWPSRARAGCARASSSRRSRRTRAGEARQETSAARQGSDQRAASAGADATRPLKQDAMEADTFTRPGIGDGAQVGLGDAARGGIGADEAGQQQLSFYQEAATTARPDSAPRTAPPAAAQPRKAQPSSRRGQDRQATTAPGRVSPGRHQPRWPPRAPLRLTRSAATGAAGTASRTRAGTRRPVSSPAATVPPVTVQPRHPRPGQPRHPRPERPRHPRPERPRHPRPRRPRPGQPRP